MLSLYDVELPLLLYLQIWHKADYQLMVDALCAQLPHTYCFYKYACRHKIPRGGPKSHLIVWQSSALLGIPGVHSGLCTIGHAIRAYILWKGL